jgi:hypothetical protein
MASHKIEYDSMKKKLEHLKLKLTLGSIAVAIGLLAASFAMFGWMEQINSQSILGNYGRYICAFGGFGAMIFGAMLVNDFLLLRKPFARKMPHRAPSKTKEL